MADGRRIADLGSATLQDRAQREEVLRAWITKSASAVRRFLFGMCGNWHEAEDLAQEALLKAWRKRDSFDGRASVSTWIFTIARNHWRDHLRRQNARPKRETMTEEMQISSSGPQPHTVAARGELAVAIGVAMDKLPAEQREALALRESKGLTFRQIAETLDLPAATVKSRVRYALLKLADELKPYARELES